MKSGIRLVLLSTLGLILLCACEKDDVCVGLITPRLLVQFYSNEAKAVDNAKETDNTKETDSAKKAHAELTLSGLSITALSKKGRDTLYTDVTTDTVYLPLRIDEDQSKFEFDLDGKSTATLNISYTRKKQFVSKACGLRTIYLDLRESHAGGSIKKVIINQTDTLENEAKPGLSIYF